MEKEANKRFDPADSNEIARRYLDRIQIEMRLLDSDLADLTMNLWGEEFTSPVMMPEFSHMSTAGEDGLTPLQQYAKAARELKIVNMVGMEPDETYASIAEQGARTVRIIKPFKDRDEIYRQMDFAVSHDAFAVGIDIDHPFGEDGGYDVVDGFEMRPLTVSELEKFAQYAKVPFIAKGVISVTDAAKCAAAGCDGIFVSHHHGRMPFCIPPVMALPEIAHEVGGKNGMKIFVDCHIDDGRDAFKALALGADAVSVGRGMMQPLMKKGTAGVIEKVTSMNAELRQLMNYTGIRNLSEMTSSVLWLDGKRL